MICEQPDVGLSGNIKGPTYVYTQTIDRFSSLAMTKVPTSNRDGAANQRRLAGDRSELQNETSYLSYASSKYPSPNTGDES